MNQQKYFKQRLSERKKNFFSYTFFMVNRKNLISYIFDKFQNKENSHCYYLSNLVFRRLFLLKRFSIWLHSMIQNLPLKNSKLSCLCISLYYV